MNKVFRFYRGRFEQQSVVGVNHQKSSPRTVSPFGNEPYELAGSARRQFADPLGAYFGVQPNFGNGPNAQKKQRAWQQSYNAIDQGTGPLSQFAKSAAGFLPQVFGQAQEAGSRIASMAPQLFNFLMQQSNAAGAALPGIMQNAQNQTQAAQGFLSQAQSPIASQALYQDALRQGLEGSRGASAARGLLDAGSAQAGEETMGRDLASQFAERRFGEQQQALSGAQGALQTQAGLLPLGTQLAGAQGQALQQLMPALMAKYQLPMEALQQVYQQLAAFQDPRTTLLQLTAPQIGQSSQGGGWNIIGASTFGDGATVEWVDGHWERLV